MIGRTFYKRVIQACRVDIQMWWHPVPTRDTSHPSFGANVSTVVAWRMQWIEAAALKEINR